MNRIPCLVLLLLAASLPPAGLCEEPRGSTTLFGISLTTSEESAREAETEFRNGHSSFTGEGSEKDPAAAIVHFTKAAELGHPRAQFNLGLCYMKGEAVEQSDQSAAEWLRKAADQGITEAYYPLGICCYNLEQYPDAYAWALMAESTGDTRLKEILEPMYSGDEISNGKARFEELKKAAGKQGKPKE